MKIDKGRGVVINNKSKNHEHFTKLNHDPKEKIETKIQGALKKIKSYTKSQEYSVCILLDPLLENFMIKAKIHKIILINYQLDQ